jgi:hypothetical protein
MWQEPIFDRTLLDVSEVDGASPANMKGARNASDLNRISGNMKHIRERLLSLGFSMPPIESRGNWLASDIPRYSDILLYKEDITNIREAFPLNHEEIPELPYTHYEKLNNIERIIFETESHINRIIAAFRYSGTFHSGTEELV